MAATWSRCNLRTATAQQPTLIATLRSDDLDFRCVAIFACADSCAASDAEVAFVEPAPSLQDLRDN